MKAIHFLGPEKMEKHHDFRELLLIGKDSSGSVAIGKG